MSTAACNIQSDPEKLLDIAVKNNDIEKVKKLLDAGAQVEPEKKKGWTPLMVAVVRNRPEMADLLISRGADLRARNKSQTLLHLVARYGKNDMAEYLLKRGVNPRKRDWLSWTPLMWASLLGKTDMVKTFIAWGANVNTRDVDNNTPLILAAWRGHKATARLLLSNNAYLDAVNNDGFDAAAIAEKHNFPKLAEELRSLAKERK